MQPDSLLVTHDAQVQAVFRRLVRDVEMSLEVATGTAAARHLLAIRKFDAILVDCDDVVGASEILRDLRQDPLNRRAITFAILNRTTSAGAAFRMGAHFVLDKPINADRSARTLRAASGIIGRERRRYSRVAVELPVFLCEGQGEKSAAPPLD